MLEFASTEAAHRWACEHLASTVESLTEDQIDALRSYKGFESRRINSALRAGAVPPELQATISHMDRALQLSKLPTELRVFHGMQHHQVASMTTRQIHGVEIRFKGYVSTSLVAGEALEYYPRARDAVLLNMTVNQGSNGIYLDRIEDLRQAEVLLPRNTRVRLSSIQTVGGIRVAVAEVVN